MSPLKLEQGCQFRETSLRTLKPKNKTFIPSQDHHQFSPQSPCTVHLLFGLKPAQATVYQLQRTVGYIVA